MMIHGRGAYSLVRSCAALLVLDCMSNVVACMQCIPEDAEGHPDLEILDAQLQRHSAARLLLAIFPAASVATGALTDVPVLCQALHRRGALAAIDFATPRAPAAAIAASGCFHGGVRNSPDAAIVAAGALTGASEAAYALVYCQAGVSESSMVAPPPPCGAIHTLFAPNLSLEPSTGSGVVP